LRTTTITLGYNCCSHGLTQRKTTITFNICGWVGFSITNQICEHNYWLAHFRGLEALEGWTCRTGVRRDIHLVNQVVNDDVVGGRARTSECIGFAGLADGSSFLEGEHKHNVSMSLPGLLADQGGVLANQNNKQLSHFENSKTKC
jgi:hypothetical protein